MSFKKLLIFFCLIALSACTGGRKTHWENMYGNLEPSGNPVNIAGPIHYSEYGTYDAEVSRIHTEETSGDIKTVAVLLPLSGANADIGLSLQHSIELAFFQKQAQDIIVSFHDLSGPESQKANIIEMILAKNPDMIIGPVFAEDAKMLSRMKSDGLPVLSFTSDWNELGNGIISMALLPYQGAEAIVSKMSKDARQNILILAPDTNAGYAMANAALDSARIHDMSTAALFFYKESNTDSMKQIAEKAAMYIPRRDAADRAKSILSDVLTKESLSTREISDIERQLDTLSKKDTVGTAPFDSVLFLGNAADSKTLASFLRYYDISANDAKFYGTAMWDSPLLFSDITLIGSEYPSMMNMDSGFKKLYSDLYGAEPARISTFGYDAAMITIGALQSDRGIVAYLLDPSGYRGLDGYIRLRPNGTNERALQIMQLRGSGVPSLRMNSATNFINPIYQTRIPSNSKPWEINIQTRGINAMDYIQLPERFRNKYRSESFGATKLFGTSADNSDIETVVTILPEDDSDPIEYQDFQPTALDTVNRKLIDSIEIGGEV